MTKKKVKECLTYERMGDKMAGITKPINKMSVIQKGESRNFICEFNKNKVTKEFLDSCKKAGKLFGKRK